MSSFTIYHRLLTRVTRQVPLVEQALLTFPEHPSSPPVFCGNCHMVFFVTIELRISSVCKLVEFRLQLMLDLSDTMISFVEFVE
jgi:hypothetical protein